MTWLKFEDASLTWYMINVVIIFGILLFLSQFIARKHDNIPTLAGYSKIFGHTRYFIKHSNLLHDAIHDLYLRSKSPKLSHLFVDGKHLIMIQDTKIMDRIFNRQKSLQIFEKDENILDIYDEMIGEGILNAQSSQWQQHRNLLNNIIHIDNFNNFAVKNCIKLVKQLINHKSFKMKPSHKKQNNNHINIQITEFLDAFTLDLFLEIIFDQKLNLINMYPKQHIFSRSYNNMNKYMNQRKDDLIWKIKRWFNCGNERLLSRDIHKVNNFLKLFIKNIQQNEKYKDDVNMNNNNLLSLYLKLNDSLTTVQLRDIAMNFMFVGREKTKSLIAWCLYELCRNINIKQKLIECLDEYKQDDDDDDLFKYKDIGNKFKYLEACLLETMRLHPMIPMVTRRALFDIEIDEQHVIREGDYIMLHLWTLCRDSKQYSNPFQFRPNRWINNKNRKLDKLFFNVGLNSCLGKDLVMIFAKIFLFHFVKKYDFDLTPNQEVKYSNGYILQMSGLGMNLRICERDIQRLDNVENISLVV